MIIFGNIANQDRQGDPGVSMLLFYPQTPKTPHIEANAASTPECIKHLIFEEHLKPPFHDPGHGYGRI